MGNEKRMAAMERNRVDSVKTRKDNAEILARIEHAITVAYNINTTHYATLKKMKKTVEQVGANSLLLDKLQMLEQKIGIER
ncbi:hypothetical protein LJC18_01140 [Lachnospiraceae bacterium OttesenSCG-928-E19]|nr:hypothetical protein [Lachnospiraceae bacterium OttesenSCG-928-E19]